jgi:UDP-N-acetyl-D-galactosamine dehydrogenase
MKSKLSKNINSKIAIIGLGYVGLPLAIALARHFSVTGFDIDEDRVAQLKDGHDRTREIEHDILKTTRLNITSNHSELKGQDIYIITVPTPVTSDNQPDLDPLKKASQTVGKAIERNAIIVYESTVYPGVTEEFCGPILEQLSGLKSGVDFFLGYSPERINPGDKEHTIDRITKVVSGQTSEVTEKLKCLYGMINGDNIFVAKNIKAAEAAKVIENAQRDINIAFINEIATIVNKLGLSIYDVLDAAATKWNFLKFLPGLVGGHCIGVDPYYLAECARKLGHEPEVILAGRRINENMGNFIANAIHEKLRENNQNKTIHPARILVLGITFKEDIPDMRNTKVIDVIQHLKNFGHTIEVHDPFADPLETKKYFGLELVTMFNELTDYDCVIGAVSHKQYTHLSYQDFKALLKSNGLVADIKNMWRQIEFPKEIRYWTL